jgi:hypothetical protein
MPPKKTSLLRVLVVEDHVEMAGTVAAGLRRGS